VALLSGSPVFGAQLGLGFALGTFPLLWLGQSQLFRWQGRLSGRAIAYIQRGAALVGALILTWRLVMAEGPLDVPFCGLH
jgi:sulfite exporter TauE/SafE